MIGVLCEKNFRYERWRTEIAGYSAYLVNVNRTTHTRFRC